MADELPVPLIACGCCGVLCIAIVIFGGFATIGQTQAAVKTNWILQTVDPEPMTNPGMHWIGPWHHLDMYDTTTQQLNFKGNSALHARSKDGLPITLNLWFQYTLVPDKLFTLYTEYEDVHKKYDKVIQLIVRHKLGEYATNYTAQNLFKKKGTIQTEMTVHLREYFEKEVEICTIENVGLTDEHLPEEFKDMIDEAATQDQNYSTQNNTMANMEVEFETRLAVAHQQADITIQEAKGHMSQIEQAGQADANIIEKYVSVEMQSYAVIGETLGLNGSDLVKYLWYDQIGGGGLVQPGPHMSVFSGVNPASYIDSNK